MDISALLNASRQAQEGQTDDQAAAPAKREFVNLLLSHLDKSACECLNESDDHPFTHCLKEDAEAGGYLESDCDEQLLLNLAFTEHVKLQSIRIKAPKDKGPKRIKIFINQPTTLDFDAAESRVATQDLELTPEQLEGEVIALKFVKFQSVQNLQLLFVDNQEGGEKTQIDYLAIMGMTLGTTKMSDFKRVAGKKGERD